MPLRLKRNVVGKKPVGDSRREPSPLPLPHVSGLRSAVDQNFVLRCARVHPSPVLAIDLMKAQLTLPPDYWRTQVRWTKSHYHPYDSSSARVSSYAVLACAVSPNERYSWISPWLFD